MKRTLMLPIAATVLVLIATGCAAPRPLELTAADSGSTVTLAPDQELVITLEGNPTTGYQWEIEGALPEMLVQVGEPAYTADSEAIGSGGEQTWRFLAVTAGEGELRMKYWRSFEPTAAPVETFSARVNVK